MKDGRLDQCSSEHDEARSIVLRASNDQSCIHSAHIHGTMKEAIVCCRRKLGAALVTWVESSSTIKKDFGGSVAIVIVMKMRDLSRVNRLLGSPTA